MNRTATVESFLSTANVTDALCALSDLFRLDGDVMSCRGCGHNLPITKRHQPFRHAPGCRHEHEGANPWELLTKALTVGREKAVVTALEQTVAVLEMLCRSSSPTTAGDVTDAQLADAVNKAIEDGNTALSVWNRDVTTVEGWRTGG